MKKQITSLLLSTLTLLCSSNTPPELPPYEFENYGNSEATFGLMAKYADVAGIGLVLPEREPPIPILPLDPLDKEQTGYFIVRVEHPFVGCETNQEIRIRHDGYPEEEPPIGLWQTDPEAYLRQFYLWEYYLTTAPTSGARVVFNVVYYEEYEDWAKGAANWNILHEDLPLRIIYDGIPRPKLPIPENPTYKFTMPEREWWYLTEANEPITTHYTNILAAVRTQRNWTNYYEICRNNLTSNIERIRWDAGTDITNLFNSASDERLLYMRNDPLLPQSIIDEGLLDLLISRPGLRWPQPNP